MAIKIRYGMFLSSKISIDFKNLKQLFHQIFHGHLKRVDDKNVFWENY